MGRKKTLLLIEPFFGGSHRKWSQEIAKKLNFNTHLLTLPERFWKWRMYGGAITLARRAHTLTDDIAPDLILAGSMFDLTTFRALAPPRLRDVPVALYFHENQFAYPEQDNYENRSDLHYRWINYISALAANHVLFNSRYNRDSFFFGLTEMLSTFPEYRNMNTIDEIRKKTKILPLGIDLEQLATGTEKTVHGPASAHTKAPPLLLWNHRWEHDKNPEEFFRALEKLRERNLDFHLAVCGKSYSQSPPIFKNALGKFSTQLVHFGHASLPVYRDLLKKTRFLPVTSNQDFFGISVIEAVFAGAIPLLPQRLAYPDILPPECYPECYYEGDLADALIRAFQWPPEKQAQLSQKLKKRLYRYDWSNMKKKYESLFENLISTKSPKPG